MYSWEKGQNSQLTHNKRNALRVDISYVHIRAVPKDQQRVLLGVLQAVISILGTYTSTHFQHEIIRDWNS